MSTLQELIARVEAASEPDRDLDGEIEVAMFGGTIIQTQDNHTMTANIAVRRPSANHVGGFAREHVPGYTASLDAAVRLVEEKLPGWSYGFAMRGDKLRREGCDDERAYAWLKNGDQADADAPTLPLAILSALLEALAETTDQSKEYVK